MENPVDWSERMSDRREKINKIKEKVIKQKNRENMRQKKRASRGGGEQSDKALE